MRARRAHAGADAPLKARALANVEPAAWILPTAWAPWPALEGAETPCSSLSRSCGATVILLTRAC